MNRIFNFSAGPAVLPLEVLEEAQRHLLELPGVGMSILEISHRSKTFDDIIQGCEADMRTLAKIPGNYKILFLQGGASLQFSMVPMNLLPAGASADYIDGGSWADKAIAEARKVGRVHIAASTRAEGYARLPRQSELQLSPEVLSEIDHAVTASGAGTDDPPRPPPHVLAAAGARMEDE